MKKQFIAQAVTLYDRAEDMVIGTLMVYKNEPIPWMPSTGILLFNGDGYSSDMGYTVYVNIVGKTDTGMRVYIDGEKFNADVMAYSD